MAKTDGKVIATIEVDIDIALNFLESQFPNPEVRWGELRSLIAKQKAAEHRVHADGAYWCCQNCNSFCSVEFDICGLCKSPRR